MDSANGRVGPVLGLDENLRHIYAHYPDEQNVKPTEEPQGDDQRRPTVNRNVKDYLTCQKIENIQG